MACASEGLNRCYFDHNFTIPLHCSIFLLLLEETCFVCRTEVKRTYRLCILTISTILPPLLPFLFPLSPSPDQLLMSSKIATSTRSVLYIWRPRHDRKTWCLLHLLVTLSCRSVLEHSFLITRSQPFPLLVFTLMCCLTVSAKTNFQEFCSL